MKKNIYLLTILSFLVFSSCSKPGEKALEIDQLVEYLPVQTRINGRWGMMSTSGRLMFEDEFVDRPSLAINGLFAVTEGDGMSLYSIADQPRLVGDCEGMDSVGYFNDGLIPVSRPGQRISVIGPDGQVRFMLGPINNKEIIGCSRMYSDGILIVTDADGLSGSVNARGEVVINPQYGAIHDFSDGYAVAQTTDGVYALIGRDGNIVCSVNPRYRIVSRQVIFGHVVVADSINHFGFMNVDGDISRLPGKVKAVGKYNRSLFAFQAENGLWGLMSRNGANDMLMRPKFKSISILEDKEAFLVNLDDAWSIINIQGKKIIDFGDRYTQVIAPNFRGSIRFLAKDNAGWVLLDDAGKEIHTSFDIFNVAYDMEDDKSSTNTTLRPTITPEMVVEMVSAQISPNSLCGIQLNAISNRWYKNQQPGDLVDTKEFNPDSIPDFHTVGDATVIGVTDKLVSVAMRFNKVTESIEYAFMPSNTVAAIELDLDTKLPDVFAKTKTLFIEAIKAKGYRLIDESDDVISFRSPYANLEISAEDDTKTMTILLYRL